MTTPDPALPEPGADASIDDLQADIEATRAQVGDTVGALASKLDVKSRAKDQVAHAKETVRSTSPTLPIAAAAVIVIVLAGVVLARRRSGDR
jgi:hypothetical protein